MSDSDCPVKQYIKVPGVLDVVPGHSRSPEDGVPVVIVVVENAGEIEQPIMLKLPDVERFAYGLVGVLAYHGNGWAKATIKRYFNPENGSDGKAGA